MPLPDKAEALAAIEAGDIIRSINDTKITSVEQLNSTYEAIEVGDDVTVEIESGGATKTLMFKKPEPPQMRMQIRTN